MGAVYYHYAQRPMVCEALNDGTGRWRCVPETVPTPLWQSIVFWGVMAAIFLSLLGIWLYNCWEFRRWERTFGKRKP